MEKTSSQRCNAERYAECSMRRRILDLKRLVRWLKDCSDRKSLEFDTVLSRVFEETRALGLECLTNRNTGGGNGD